MGTCIDDFLHVVDHSWLCISGGHQWSLHRALEKDYPHIVIAAHRRWLDGDAQRDEHEKCAGI